jgi:hypothetical protein
MIEREFRREPTQEPVSLESAIQEIIKELQTNRRWKQPTKIEQILTQFLERSQKPIELDELISIFSSDIYDSPQAVRNHIIKANAKLERYGFRIAHTTAYRIISTKRIQS